MKTTLDLPEDLVRKLKMRAVRDRLKLKDLATELLRKGLSSPPSTGTPLSPTIAINKRSRLPVIQCKPLSKNKTPTPDDIARILSQQETDWSHASA